MAAQNREAKSLILDISDAIQQLFQSQLQSQVETQVISGSLVRKPNEVVFSQLELKSANRMGTLTFFFPISTIEKIVKNWIGNQGAVSIEMCADSAGEMINIVYATARKKINEKGDNFAPAIPKFWVYKPPVEDSSPSQDISALNCSTQLGSLGAELRLKRIA